MLISGHVTQGNDSCNLCRNGAIKLRDKLQEKLPSVAAPLVSGALRHAVIFSFYFESSKESTPVLEVGAYKQKWVIT